MSVSEDVKVLFDVYGKEEPRILEEYFQFLRFQSISSEPEYSTHVLECQEWLAEYLAKIGLTVSVWPSSAKHPTVFAEWSGAGPDKPTLLIYGHYDVQPVDPIELWNSPPFEPTVLDGEVFARGAADDKGQIFYAIQAIRHYLQSENQLPLNVKLLIEGEEEIGSPGLPQILAEHAELLKADHLLIVDVGIPSLNAPSVTLGIRGMLCMTVEMTGSKTDLHSGSFGGIAYNPNHAMIEVLGKLRDPNGRVAVPGFYDDVIEISKEERGRICRNISLEDYHREYGVYPSGGESEFTPCESNWLRPTLEVNGICGGYFGTGFKTVIPAKAIGKVSCRLVPNQNPQVIGQLVREFILSNVPQGITCSVTLHPGDGPAVRSSPDCQTVKGCAQAFSEVFGVDSEFVLDGATIPVAAQLAKVSGAELALIGVGLLGDQIHAPNEHFGLGRMRLGFAVMSRVVEIFGNLTK